MKKVLVTGAGGFIGRWSVPALLAAGYEVHAVVSETKDRALVAQLQGARLHAVDLLNDASRDALCDELGATHLLHFAWIATPGIYWTSADNLRWLDAGRRLLQRFHMNGGVRTVMAGSCAEYDWLRASLCNERTSPLIDPADEAMTPYARCKVLMQRALEDFSGEHALSSAWGRIFFQFGPNEHPQRLVPSVITHLLTGREALCSHGRQVRSFLHVADVGGAFAALLDSAVEGPVNVGSAEQLSLGALITRIAERIGRPDLVRLGARPSPVDEPPVLLPDVDRLRRELRWQPHFDLQAGLADTIDWWHAKLQAAGSPAP